MTGTKTKNENADQGLKAAPPF